MNDKNDSHESAYAELIFNHISNDHSVYKKNIETIGEPQKKISTSQAQQSRITLLPLPRSRSSRHQKLSMPESKAALPKPFEMNQSKQYHQPKMNNSHLINSHVQAIESSSKKKVKKRSHQLDPIDQLANLVSQQNRAADSELIQLQNFVTSTSSTKKYCNACCANLQASELEFHLKSIRHLNNHKDLNNQLLAVNLFQISKHYNQSLTSELEKQFMLYDAIKENKLQEYQNFKNFLERNLKFRYELTLYGSITNEAFIEESDINVNIELLEEKNETNCQILSIVKQLVTEKYGHVLEAFEPPFQERYDHAYFRSKNNNIINLISVEKLKHSNLIGQYVEFDPRVKMLMFCIRKWAHICELDAVAKGSYRPALIQIMVIYFLQHCNQAVLPNFHKLLQKQMPAYAENECKNHQIEPISDNELEIVKKTFRCKNTQNVGELWIDFFKFYLFHFDHESTYVNIVHHEFKAKISKAFSVCQEFDGSVFSVIYNWRFHFERLTKLFFEMYKHSCLPSYPAVNTNNLNAYLEFIFSTRNFRRDNDFKLTRIKDDQKAGRRARKFSQFQLKHLWLLSIKFNFKVCIKQELDNYKRAEFIMRINKSISYPYLPWFCILCKSKNHFVAKCDNMQLPDLMPLIRSRVDKCALAIDLISDFYYKVKSLNDNRQILRTIDIVKNSLNQAIQSLYPNSQLELYGSVLNGFGHVESDLDFALLFLSDEIEDLEMNHKKIVKHISCAALENNPKVKDLIVITKARVPIIKLKYEIGTHSFLCDISIDNRLAFCNTHFLRTYCTIDNRVPKLGLLVKKFTKICQIGYANQGGLNSYAFNLMLIHFLQQCDPPVLPVLHELDVEHLKSETISGWEVKFFQDLDRIEQVWPAYRKNRQSVGELFIGFFIFYTEFFDFDKDVITIKQSAPLTKLQKKWTTTIAIEDPFLLSHNLASALEISMANYVKSSFILARNHFTNFAEKSFSPSTRVQDLYTSAFEHSSLKSSEMLPFGKGCQVCFKIGHKKAHCPELRNGKTKADFQASRHEETFPIDFEVTLNEICKQHLKYLVLLEEFEKFDSILKLRH